MNKRNIKILNLICVIVILLSNFIPTISMAASKNTFKVKNVSTHIKTTKHNESWGIAAKHIYDSTTNKWKTAFCIEMGEKLSSGDKKGEYTKDYPNKDLSKAYKVAYVGWYLKHGDAVIYDSNIDKYKYDYAFTQQLIWQVLGYSAGSFVNSYTESDYQKFKTNVLKKITEMDLDPSFNGKTVQIDLGDNTILTDSNNVLKSYPTFDVSDSGIRFQHTSGSNDMKVTITSSCTINSYQLTASKAKKLGMQLKYGGEDFGAFIFDDKNQSVMTTNGYTDDPLLFLNLKINLLGNLELSKLDTEGNLINGSKFRVTGPNSFNKLVAVENGKIKLEKLPIGIYTVKEEIAPKGYLLNIQAYNVEVKVNQTASQAIVDNEPTGAIQVIKKSEQGDLIKGTVFKVLADEDIKNVAKTKTYYTKGQEVANITTNTKGLAEITNLPLGKYIVEETQATAGYLLDSTKHNITLSYKGQTEKIILESFEKINTTPTGEIKVYKTNSINNGLKGAEISLYAREEIKNVAGTKVCYKKGDLVSKAVTNEQGIATFSNLHLGHYYVKETNAPEGYLLNTKEFDANLKYKDQTTKVIYLDINNVIDEEPTGIISIIKKDSKTGSVTQGDAKLENAVYKVYANEDIYNVAKSKKFYSKGDLVATRTTNAKGVCEDVTNLPLGKYLVKEETAPIGYLIDKKKYEVNLVYKDQYTKVITGKAESTDKVKEMRVHIFKSGIKVNSGKTPGLAGAEFTIKLNSAVERAYAKGYTYAEVWNGIDEYGNKVEVNSKRIAEAQVIAPTYAAIVTDKNGDAYTEKVLPYGTYITKETVTPKDYESSADFTFSITEDESEVIDIAKKVKHIVVNNEQLETYIKLIKKDLKTGKTVTLNSATFQIKARKDIYDRATGKILYKKGEAVTQKIGSTIFNSFTTNAKNLIVPDNSYNNNKEDLGTIITPLKLEVGTYEITEIRTPQGFLQLEKPVTFNVEGVRDYDKDNEGDYIKEVVVKNEKPTGTVIIDKSVALREDVDTSIVDISDLSKIEFSLTAKEDIIDYSDGSTIYKKGQLVKNYNLDKNGDLRVEELPMGTYELQEIKTLDGLVLNDKKYEIKFEQKDLVTKVYEVKEDISNDTTVLEFSKTDITGEKELVGAKLTVIDENDKVVDSWTSGEKTHKIEGLVVGKEYTLKEETAPNGFVVATEIKFRVENTTEIQKVTMIDKILEVVKTDLVTGEEIEGAELKVIDEDGNVIDKWISTKEPHKVVGLEENKKYKLVEITAPYGYEVTEKIEFTVSENKETQRVEMKDMPILQDIKLVKIDGNTKEVIKDKFTFGIYEDAECTKLIKEVKSDKENGTVLFKDLRYGTYYIKEIAAPKGYVLSDKVIKVEMNDKGTFIDNEKVESEDSVYTFEFENVPVDTPKTGDNSNLKLYAGLLGVSLIALASVGVHEYKKKKSVNKK